MNSQYQSYFHSARNEHLWWDSHNGVWLDQYGRRVDTSQRIDTQSTAGSPRTPHLPPIPLTHGPANVPAAVGSPTSPYAQGYTYNPNPATLSSSTGPNLNVQREHSVSFQQPLTTSAPLLYHRSSSFQANRQIDDLSTGVASTFLGQRVNAPTSTFQESASGSSLSSYGSGASGIAPYQEEALSRNARTHSHIRNVSGGNPGQLNPRYRFKKKSFFKRGRVFKVLWHEPGGGGGGDDSRTNPSSTGFDVEGVSSDLKYGEKIYTKFRWLIVIRSGKDSCVCVPIVTYNRQGVAKRGVVKGEHAVAYASASGKSPSPDPRERAGRDEQPMRRPVRIQPDEPGDKLDDMARINYARCYTVEHNVKVMPFGWVHDDSEKEFLYSWKNVLLQEDDDDEDSSSDGEQGATGRRWPTSRRANERNQRSGKDGPAIHSESSTATLRRPAPEPPYQQQPPTSYGVPGQGRGVPLVPNQRHPSDQQNYTQGQFQGQSGQRTAEPREEDRREPQVEQQRRSEQQQQLDTQQQVGEQRQSDRQRPRQPSGSQRRRLEDPSSKNSRKHWPYK